MVNEPSVFESLRFYRILKDSGFSKEDKHLMEMSINTNSNAAHSAQGLPSEVNGWYTQLGLLREVKYLDYW